ncbi:hypothetical protein ACFT5C_33020 [Streptomyces sp. NPDC057116]|uniref:hypothetical protein n=1 Tax=Streptomyces sp. NPDC057116 TaxID=3346023 RepID=UPI00362E48D8
MLDPTPSASIGLPQIGAQQSFRLRTTGGWLELAGTVYRLTYKGSITYTVKAKPGADPKQAVLLEVAHLSLSATEPTLGRVTVSSSSNTANVDGELRVTRAVPLRLSHELKLDYKITVEHGPEHLRPSGAPETLELEPTEPSIATCDDVKWPAQPQPRHRGDDDEVHISKYTSAPAHLAHNWGNGNWNSAARFGDLEQD